MKTKEIKPRFDLFDLIRFIACLLIVYYHYDGVCNYQLRINQSATFDWIIRHGGEAIVLFFMLSGFCMAHGYRDRIRNKEVPAGIYAWKHYKKFLVMTLLTVPLTIVKAFFMYKAGMDTVPNLYGFLLDILEIRTGYGLSSSFGYNGPLWFINVLFLVYMLYYLICSLCRSEAAYIAVSLILMLFSMSEQAGQMLSFFILNKDTYIGIMGFFGGVLIYEGYEYCQHNIRLCRKINLMCTIFLITAVCACYLNTHWPGVGVLQEGEDLWVNTKLALTILVWTPLVFLSAQVRLNRKHAATKAIRWLGGFATGIYIWHWPILYIYYCLDQMGYAGWSLHSLIGFLTVFVCTTILTLLTKPILDGKKMKKPGV